MAKAETLRQKLHEQINEAQARLQELRDIRDRLEALNILDAKISDIQAAMQQTII
jgi:hypothetical protein